MTRSSKATVREVIGLHAPEPDIDEYVDLEASLATPSLPPSLTMLAATSPERHSEPGRAGSVWAPPTLQRTTPPSVPDGRAVEDAGEMIPFGRPSPATAPAVARQPATPRPEMLLPYEAWDAHPLPEVAFATQRQLVDGLVEIITAEVPMHALYAYQLYLKAAGGHRVAKEARRTFNQATHVAVRAGLLAQLDDKLVGQIDKTLYIPGTPSVVIRELGPRTLVEVPRSELMLLAGSLLREHAELETLKRAILDTLGLTRLTERVSAYLDDCFNYGWTE